MEQRARQTSLHAGPAAAATGAWGAVTCRRSKERDREDRRSAAYSTTECEEGTLCFSAGHVTRDDGEEEWGFGCQWGNVCITLPCVSVCFREKEDGSGEAGARE
jgi:hypothetical protein